MTIRRRSSIVAGVLWILSALVHLSTEAVTAAAFTGYSYATNYISDLGIPEVGEYQGRAIDSPLHLVMNVGFVVQGALYLAAVCVVVRACATRERRMLVALAIVYAIGISLVGIVHGSQASDDNGSAIFHVLGAGMAIISGNVVAIAVGIGVARERPRSPYALASIALGAIGLSGLAMLQIDAGTTTIDLLPDGVWERIAVYAVTAWQLMTGTVLLTRKTDGSEARLALTRDRVTSAHR
ncbi:DUF998 domain-containing protein [Agrococcus jenensis]|uniref:Putative membrane protein n=1 Tax=Agrococcus jenensis TaxID=46353 RepID=A0A3N2ASS5_9MICO|nr:DUF998 domain-containing protein [Agrococcus jenensis]ROR65802.1 putative membrane protein [Agrococcus jenensis]